MIDVLVNGLPPGLLLIVAAVPAVLLPHRLSQVAMLALPILGLAHLMSMPIGFEYSIAVFDYTLQVTRIDALSRVFGIVFHIAAFLGVLYASHQRDRLQAAAAMIYAGAGIAAVFAGDLLTLFVWWELTAISSVFLVWASRTEAALRPASAT
jgi:multicomponent Na+:H+ antiporter subunit D